jgi:hypothetical protein
VAAGGSLTRLGHYEYLYIAMSTGVGLIFLGVLRSRRPELVRAAAPAERAIRDAAAIAAAVPPMPHATVVDDARGPSDDEREPVPVTNPAISYIETALLPLDDAELERVCTEWSVPPDASTALSRHDARRAWRLRMMLADASALRFDAHSVGARRQLTVLYHEVLAWDRANPEEITELIASSDMPPRPRQAQGM